LKGRRGEKPPSVKKGRPSGGFLEKNEEGHYQTGEREKKKKGNRGGKKKGTGSCVRKSQTGIPGGGRPRQP